MMERLATTVTALTNTVKRIKLQESVFVRVPAETMTQYGFGRPPDEALSGPVNDIFKRWMFVETVTFTCLALFGRAPERVDHLPVYEPASEDIAGPTINIRKGTTRFVRHIFHAILDGVPKVTIELLWYIRKEDAPFRDEGGTDKWKIEIEGHPCSLKLTLEAMASIDRNLDLHEGDPTMPSYYATASVLLQAVPVICAAPPGIVYATTFTNSVEDFRHLASRSTLVT